MNQQLTDAINTQIKEELYSGYLYWAMAAYAEEKGLSGIANWFVVQAQEELDHARGFYNYLVERGARAEFQAIEKPPVEFDSVLDIFEKSLAHEKHITAKINDLYELAGNEKDFATQSFLKWYIDEQVEEEDNANTNIDKIKLVGETGQQLYMLDKELSTRVYAPSSILGQVE